MVVHHRAPALHVENLVAQRLHDPPLRAHRLGHGFWTVRELGAKTLAADRLMNQLHGRLPIAPGKVETTSVLLVDEAFVVGLVYGAHHWRALAHLDAHAVMRSFRTTMALGSSTPMIADDPCIGLAPPHLLPTNPAKGPSVISTSYAQEILQL